MQHLWAYRDNNQLDLDGDKNQGDPYGQHIGRPVANTQVYILDPRMEPARSGLWEKFILRERESRAAI